MGQRAVCQDYLEQQRHRRGRHARKIKSVGWEILLSVKLDMEEKLRQLEKHIPGSVSLSSGGCNLCKLCSRKDGHPCRQPDKMRYSLDAFGFDLTAITKDMFDIDILWCKERLLDYFTLIHGILTKEEMPDDLWGRLGVKISPTTHHYRELAQDDNI